MKRAELDKKDMLNPKEASIYFGIPEMKLRAYLKVKPIWSAYPISEAAY